ncbi:NB-ARC domain-containing protein [Streptomyces sp. NBC_00876]|nr:NB-ARC domain-containing protein [Streptomyces sp. NBC_00876]
MELWQQACVRGSGGPPRGSPNPLTIDGIGSFKAGLRTLYELAGRPSMREMERQAGTGCLPHSTAHRIVRGRTVPRDVHQLTGFLRACSIGPAEHPLWIDAWRRVLGQEFPPVLPLLPQRPTGVAPVAVTTRPEIRASDGPVGVAAILAGPPPELQFSVLGPVRARRGDETLPSGSPQQRALLAALLMRHGRTATAGELIDAIWGEDPPSQALAAVRTYASRLRKTLGPLVLASESGGYVMRIEREALDLTMAEDLAAEAEKDRASGNHHRARALLNAALGLWDGEALASVPGPYAENQRTRLEEWRLQLTETRLDLDLEVGCHAETVSELTALTAAHPLRERLRELLMVALYRSGRQAEALAVYADTRRLLAEELGVDPRPELAALQQRILQADEELARPADEPAPAGTPVRPAQLPATVADFTGRTALIQELGDQLATAKGVSVLSGIGGVGKTTLAVHVAHRARWHFPDGQLYVSLQGEGSWSAEPGKVLGAFLRALGVPDSAVPDSLDERAALYRSTLDGRRVLVLLDDAHDAAQVRPLLPGTAGCAALVTSRVRMAGLAGAHLVDLDVMSPEEAFEHFTRIVGHDRVDPERSEARYVIAACGFLPLAIRIAASRVAARRTWTIATMSALLADETGRLAQLQAGDLAVRPVMEQSYTRLDAEQARAFRLLSTSTSAFLSLSESTALLDRSPVQGLALLEGLIDAGLLMPVGPGHYQVHALARLFALSLTP